MVEPKLPKLLTWVRFPSPAPPQRLEAPRSPLKRKRKAARKPVRAIEGRVLQRNVDGATRRSRIAAVASRLPVLRRFAPPPPPPKPQKKSRVRQVLGVPGRVI